jgi:hypothetical protein
MGTKYPMRQVKLNENPQHHDNYHLVYRRPLVPKGDTIWQFCGYRCLNCDRVIKQDNTLVKHSVTCKPYVRVYKMDNEPEIILNNKRTEWVPYTVEMNQVPGDNSNLENDK